MHSVCLQLYKKQSPLLNFPKKNPKISPNSTLNFHEALAQNKVYCHIYYSHAEFFASACQMLSRETAK